MTSGPHSPLRKFSGVQALRVVAVRRGCPRALRWAGGREATDYPRERSLLNHVSLCENEASHAAPDPGGYTNDWPGGVSEPRRPAGGGRQTSGWPFEGCPGRAGIAPWPRSKPEP